MTGLIHIARIHQPQRFVLNQAVQKLREYSELEDMYISESRQLQVELHGPERFVGLFKNAIMTFAIGHANSS